MKDEHTHMCVVIVTSMFQSASNSILFFIDAYYTCLSPNQTGINNLTQGYV